jgi:hypothetical protein
MKTLITVNRIDHYFVGYGAQEALWRVIVILQCFDFSSCIILSLLLLNTCNRLSANTAIIFIARCHMLIELFPHRYNALFDTCCIIPQQCTAETASYAVIFLARFSMSLEFR